MITALDQLLAVCNYPQKAAIVWPTDAGIFKAVKPFIEAKQIIPVFCGNKPEIENLCHAYGLKPLQYTVIHSNDQVIAAHDAVVMAENHEVGILMKGMVSTSIFVKAILHSTLLENILTHITIFKHPLQPKLVALSDAAINIAPDIETKVAIINNAVDLMKKLGYGHPKVAMVCPVEKPNPKIASTQDALILKDMNLKGEIKNCMVDGPFALDNALSAAASEMKNIKSEVAGNADVLVVHNLDAGNILYKSIGVIAGQPVAAVVAGAKVPIVLTSRADNEITRYYSLLLALHLTSANKA
ncbi:MAG TPA: phosphate acyltransferase [Bacteroidales bacterium]|nr:phosphate acyltransferase [Bacteroidales bacterium]